jgi:hypothetical protein
MKDFSDNAFDEMTPFYVYFPTKSDAWTIQLQGIVRRYDTDRILLKARVRCSSGQIWLREMQPIADRPFTVLDIHHTSMCDLCLSHQARRTVAPGPATRIRSTIAPQPIWSMSLPRDPSLRFLPQSLRWAFKIRNGLSGGKSTRTNKSPLRLARSNGFTVTSSSGGSLRLIMSSTAIILGSGSPSLRPRSSGGITRRPSERQPQRNSLRDS